MPLVLFPNGSIARVKDVPKGGFIISEKERVSSPTIRVNHTAAVRRGMEKKNDR